MPGLEQSLLYTILNDCEKSLSDFNIFVETGTFMGDTSYTVSSLFQKVYTIEVYEPLYLQACKRFQNTNVEVVFGDSTQALFNLLPNLPDNMVFWLDGHNSGSGTGVGQIDFPLLEECDLIDKHFRGKEALILIDDVRLFGKGHPAQIDDSLLNLTVEKVLETFSKRTVKYHQIYPSEVSSTDRLAILIV